MIETPDVLLGNNSVNRFGQYGRMNGLPRNGSGDRNDHAYSSNTQRG